MTVVMPVGKENSTEMMHEPGTNVEDSSCGSGSKLARRAGSVFVEGALSSENMNYTDDQCRRMDFLTQKRLGTSIFSNNYTVPSTAVGKNLKMHESSLINCQLGMGQQLLPYMK